MGKLNLGQKAIVEFLANREALNKIMVCRDSCCYGNCFATLNVTASTRCLL